MKLVFCLSLGPFSNGSFTFALKWENICHLGGESLAEVGSGASGVFQCGREGNSVCSLLLSGDSLSGSSDDVLLHTGTSDNIELFLIWGTLH